MIVVLRQYWFSLSVRERMIVAAGAVLLGIMLLFVLIWQPILDGRSRLSKLLPRQQQNLQQVQWLAGQIQVLQSGAATVQRLDRDAAISQASASAETAASSVLVVSNERVKVVFDQLAFSQWVKFAAAMQASGWPAVTADIVSLDRAGKVRASAEFGR